MYKPMTIRYKQTDIGEIPDDWEIDSLRNAFPRLDTGVSVNSDDNAISNYYILKTSAVRNGFINVKEVKPVVTSDFSRLKCYLKQGTILISRMNTPEMVGECGYSTVNTHNIFLPDRLWQIEPSKTNDYNFIWLNYLLNTTYYKKQLRLIATGTSNSMKNIAKERLLDISVPKPPIQEQERIAEALSDVDALITSLEKLIAKKRAIKQGTMQRLLTGKTRLPGFSGKWEEKRLHDLCTIVMGQSPDSHYYNDSCGLPLIQGNADIENRKTIIHFYTTQTTKQGNCGDIIFTVRAPVGNVAKTYFDCCLGRGVCALRDAPDFLYHYLIFIEPYWSSLSTGSTFDSINLTTLANTIIQIPTNSKEQNAIATIFSNMDNEIESLSQKLAKARRLKQGMMQQLLTGKIRISK